MHSTPIQTAPAPIVHELPPSFVEVWNTILAAKFTRYRRQLVRGAGEHAAVALDGFGIAEGSAVLDVGCGFGESCIDLGHRVGPRGRVVGIDCTRDFIETARAEVRAAGLSNVELVVTDAEKERLDPTFDVAFARFGTMFFESPVAAMRNVQSALVPGGRLLMTVWRTIDDNPWFGVAKAVARRHLPPPPDTAATCGPGPFSMQSPDRVRSILKHAGFRDVELRRVDLPYWLGDTVDEAIAFNVALGPSGETIREAGALGQQMLPTIHRELSELLAPYQTPEGVFLGSSSWAVTAVK